MHARQRDIANAKAFMDALANEPPPDPPAHAMSPSDIPQAMSTNRWARSRCPTVQIDLQSVIADAAAQMLDVDHAPREELRASSATAINDDTFADLPWGTLHPDRHRGPKQRARWTPFEVQFIGRWCEEALSKYPAMTQVINKCRESLAKDYPDMIAYFHVNHVISTGRFVHGYRLFKRG
jgi:hypothetical protein